MNVILADDQLEVRRALRFLLEHEADLQPVSEAANAHELLESVSRSCPDLVLLDWELPGISASDLIPELYIRCPTVKIIALSVRPEARDEALQGGVHGFVSKGDPPERLLAAVRRVAQGYSEQG